MSKTAISKSRYSISKMFDSIAQHYDVVNRVQTLGLDTVWRQKVAHYFPEDRPLRVLDLATGTADSLLMLLKLPQAQHVTRALGVDIAEKMLEVGREKVQNSLFADKINLALGDATQLEQKDSDFDVVTMMFGIRNVDNVDAALSEMYRVLDTKGRTIILEISMPENPVIRAFYLFYFRYILPNIAGLITGHKSAYDYLNRSSEQFIDPKSLCKKLKAAKFTNVQAIPIQFGMLTIYVGDKA